MNQKRLPIILFLAIICTPFATYGQEEQFQPYSFASPSSESMAQIDNMRHNVNLYTGALSLYIPLYLVTTKDIEVPVGLAYQTTGCKVGAQDTNVGLGWSNVTGGSVTRVVQGWPDEQAHWFNWPFDNKTNSQVLDMYYSKTGSYYCAVVDGESIMSHNYNTYDGEPDIFFFQAPGISGAFFFDHAGKPHTMPYQNIDIQWVQNDYFVITSNQGTKYYFGMTVKETSSIISRDDNMVSKERVMTYTSTWLLERIESFLGDCVDFEYVQGPVARSNNTAVSTSLTVKLDSPTKIEDTSIASMTTTSSMYPKFIRKVIWDNGEVEFTYKDGGLDKVVIKNLSNVTKTYLLDYGLFSYKEPDYIIVPKTARLLRSIYAQTGNVMNNLYTFYYNVGELTYDSANDHWGYYNGEWGYYSGQTYWYKTYPDLKHRVNGVDYTIPGRDQSPSLSMTKIGTLAYVICGNQSSRIDFEYELNESKGQAVGGLRISEIIRSSRNQSFTTKYIYENGILIQPVEEMEYYTIAIQHIPEPPLGIHEYGVHSFSILSHSINNPYGFLSSHIGYGKVLEIQPNGSKKEFIFSTGVSDVYKDKLGVLNYRSPNASGEGSVYDYYAECLGSIKAMNSTKFWRRGLLLEEKSYDAEGFMLRSVEYNYRFGTPKVLVKSYIPRTQWLDISVELSGNIAESRSKRYNGIHITEFVSEPIFLDSIVTYKGPYNTASVTSYIYDETYMVPKKISVTDAEGDISETVIKYPFDYKTIQTSAGMSPTSRAIKRFYDKKAYAIPIETVRNKNGKVTGAEHASYKLYSTEFAPETKYYLPLKSPISSSNFSPAHIEGNDIVFDPKYEVAEYDYQYGPKNMLYSYRKADGMPISYIYDATNSYVVAEVTNAVNSDAAGKKEVYYNSFEDADGTSVDYAKSGKKVLAKSFTISLSGFKTGKYILSYWIYKTIVRKWEYVEKTISGSVVLPGSSYQYIDEVRIYPKGAMMTTYTNEPGIGVTSETDWLGRTTHYQYNTFGKLSKVLDDERKVLKKITYDDIEF